MRKHGWPAVGLLVLAGTLAAFGCRQGTLGQGGSREAGLSTTPQMLPVSDVNHPVREGENIRIRFHSVPAHAVPPCASCHVEPGVNSVRADPAQCGACHEDRSALLGGQ